MIGHAGRREEKAGSCFDWIRCSNGCVDQKRSVDGVLAFMGVYWSRLRDRSYLTVGCSLGVNKEGYQKQKFSD